jgi:thiol-disulfide isomerase/thioredoxin
MLPRLKRSRRSHGLIRLACFVFPFLIAAATDPPKNNNNLYSVLPFEESDPVMEFEPPDVNTNYNSKGEDLAFKPDFLYSTTQGHRVVLYYLPYCPHCQAYVPVYISLARRVQEMIQTQNMEEVEFYAISCLPNRQLCKDQHVGGIPGIKIFRAGSIEGVPVDPAKLHPFQIMRILGLPWDASDDWNPAMMVILDTETRASLKGGRVINSAGRSNKQSIFQDAYRSFHFSMANEIYTENGPLSDRSRKALGDWLILLQNVLPPAWKIIHELIQELTANFDAISTKDDKLQAILANHPPYSDNWTYSCSHGKEGNGYTCGLWKLMAIATIGVVQFNENAISGNDQALYHTADVALIVRDYIDQFFACSVCRTEFLRSFDSCAFDHCHLLLDEAGKKENWIELPLWLWQEHNSVNVRLMRERTPFELTKEAEESAQWPPASGCPNCWASHDSDFNTVVTYEYLLEKYWWVWGVFCRETV